MDYRSAVKRTTKKRKKREPTNVLNNPKHRVDAFNNATSATQNLVKDLSFLHELFSRTFIEYKRSQTNILADIKTELGEITEILLQVSWTSYIDSAQTEKAQILRDDVQNILTDNIDLYETNINNAKHSLKKLMMIHTTINELKHELNTIVDPMKNNKAKWMSISELLFIYAPSIYHHTFNKWNSWAGWSCIPETTMINAFGIKLISQEKLNTLVSQLSEVLELDNSSYIRVNLGLAVYLATDLPNVDPIFMKTPSVLKKEALIEAREKEEQYQLAKEAKRNRRRSGRDGRDGRDGGRRNGRNSRGRYDKKEDGWFLNKDKLPKSKTGGYVPPSKRSNKSVTVVDSNPFALLENDDGKWR